MNRTFGAYGISYWTAATMGPLTPLALSKWAWDSSLSALSAGAALREKLSPVAPPPTSTGLTPEAQTLLERRLADYQVAPVQDPAASAPPWLYAVGGGFAVLLGVATLRALVGPGAGAPARRRRR